jgi:NhaC family Na+:H+ antiporter
MTATGADVRRLPLALALVPLLVLFGAIVAGVLTLGFSSDLLLASILLAAASGGAVAVRQGRNWADIQNEAGRRIAEALPAILILLSIGALLGSWMFSGTIPLMVVLGVDLIHPGFMALTAFAATALMSTISGTSWGSAGTIGVALMGAASAMGLPLAPVAGAVVSGAYFGDKLSPLSDMTNIAAIGAGANLYDHIRHMLWTSLPPAFIAALVYAVAGFASAGAGAGAISGAAEIKNALHSIFNLNLVAAFPLLVAIGGIALRRPPALVIMTSSLIALLIGVFAQGFSFGSSVTTLVNGFDLASVHSGADALAGDNLRNLLNRGGVMSMASTLMFIIAAFLLAATMEVSGALQSLLHALLSSVRSAFGLIAATMTAGLVMIAVTSHGGVTSLIVGGLFRKSYADRNLAPENLSRAIEDSVTVTEPLMPWTVSGLFMAGTLGVATVDLAPWAVFCFLGPVFSLLFAATFVTTGWGLKRSTPN